MSPLQINPESEWQKSFRFDHVRCLIVCRGPVRLEAMQVMEFLGAECGILVSEKDSIVYPQTLAPELRWLRERRGRAHHVPDYTGNSREERNARIQDILLIC